MQTSFRSSWALALGLALAASGCASPLAKARSDNQQLTRTVEELRLERREKDRRLRDLEKQMAMLRDQRAAEHGAPMLTPAATASNESMPALQVEVVAPPGDSDLGREPATYETSGNRLGEHVVGTDDNGSEIVYVDEALAAESEPVTLAPPVATMTRPRRVVTVADERPRSRERTARVRAPLRPSATVRAPDRAETNVAKYRDAVALLKRGSHAESIAMLREFLVENPNHDYADNAQYWLGEAFYDQKDYPHAVAEFRTTVEKFPQGNKVPDAMLKVGYCYYAMGQAEKGDTVLAELMRLYPKSEPAVLAAKRLETK
ncbi:MAG TPA: tol-pal system protein YbgF [Kofleriaceae bacterium]|nr:tol-pal system protein YbgF [Kofleriaceae bacterium]